MSAMARKGLSALSAGPYDQAFDIWVLGRPTARGHSCEAALRVMQGWGHGVGRHTFGTGGAA